MTVYFFVAATVATATCMGCYCLQLSAYTGEGACGYFLMCLLLLPACHCCQCGLLYYCLLLLPPAGGREHESGGPAGPPERK